MTPNPQWQLSLATLCDDLRYEIGGKISLMGLFEAFDLANISTPLRKFWMVARGSFDSPLATTATTIWLCNASMTWGVHWFGSISTLVASEATGKFHAGFVLPVENLVVPEYTRYVFIISLGQFPTPPTHVSQVLATVPFVVKPARAMPSS